MEDKARRGDPRCARAAGNAFKRKDDMYRWRRPTRPSPTTAGKEKLWQLQNRKSVSSASATSGSGPHRRGQDHDDRADPLLHRSHHKMGEVHEGAATMDWMAQEQERGITITSAATTAFWRDFRINIIDTPRARGLHRRSGAESARARRAVAVFDSVAGVQPHRRRSGARRTSTRSAIAFINRWTASARTFFAAVQSMRDRLARTPCRCRSRSARRTPSAASSIWSRCTRFVYKDDLGQEFDVTEARRAGARVPPPADRVIVALRRRGARGYIEDLVTSNSWPRSSL